ncbi:hypothetical protein PInf_000432 [Phytophthora infestans]|nr:hypothetical protein PInf_000432 [Phytophthora infestans]
MYPSSILRFYVNGPLANGTALFSREMLTRDKKEGVAPIVVEAEPLGNGPRDDHVLHVAVKTEKAVGSLEGAEETNRRFWGLTSFLAVMAAVMHSMDNGSFELLAWLSALVLFLTRFHERISLEVVANPSVLLLDEPTSGLNAPSALIVMRGVQSIARTGRTVLCTIHQTSILIFELFDGDAAAPACTTPRGRDVKDYSIEYKNSELYKSNRERTLQLAEVSGDFVCHSTLNYTPIATGFLNQLKELVVKQQLTYWRNPQYHFLRMFLFPRFGVIFGPTFYQLEADSVKRIDLHIGLIYNSMDFIGVINLMTVLEVTCAERAVFYREHMSNYYGPLSYSLSLWLAEVPYLIFVIVLFVTIEYWLVGWSYNGGDFLFFMFVFYLYTSATLMPNEKVVNVAVGALSCLFNLFSGYLLPRPAMMAGYKWFTYLMPSSYSLAALVGVQFGEAQDVISVTDGGVTTEMTVAQYIEDTYDFRPNRKYNFMAGLMVIWAVLQMAIYLTFKYTTERGLDQSADKRYDSQMRFLHVFSAAQQSLPMTPLVASRFCFPSYQVEGAWNEGGRTPSIWDDFCRTHHRTKVVCANVADAFYHRYRDNVKLMVDTGLQSSRFSVSWSRAMNWNPETKRMQLNPHGLAFYHALVDELITNNIVPILTLYHWDLPLELHTELSLFKAGCTQTSSTTT